MPLITVPSSPEAPPVASGRGASGQQLPVTGRDVRVPFAGAVALLAVGGICVAAARKNRKETT